MGQKIEHTGIITAIKDGVIEVSIIQKSACSDCHAKGGCTASDTDEKIVEAISDGQQYTVGETVNLTGQTSMGFLAVLLAFVIPFVLILSSLFLTRSFMENEALSGTISLAVLIPYYIILSLFNKKLKNRFQFSVTKF
jgi:positive regulator of sigma E activity